MCVHMWECVCTLMHKDVSTENKNSKRDAVSAGADRLMELLYCGETGMVQGQRLIRPYPALATRTAFPYPPLCQN